MALYVDEQGNQLDVTGGKLLWFYKGYHGEESLPEIPAGLVEEALDEYTELCNGVFEVVYEHDEGYYLLGTFKTESQARRYIYQHDGPSDDGDGQPMTSEWGLEFFANDTEDITIQRRAFGPNSGDTPTAVAHFKRRWEWADDESQEVWKTEEV